MPISCSTATARHPSCRLPGAKDVAVEFFTLSKSYNMAGWRVGFMVGNRDLVGCARAHQELSRLRHLHTDSGRLHRSAGGAAGVCGADSRYLPEAARCSMQRAERRGMAGAGAEGYDVCVGTDSAALS